MSTLLKDLSYTFLTLWHCCFTIVFGKQPCVWMLNRTGVGHRMTMIAIVPSILANFWGTRSFCIGNQDSVTEGLWSFVLFLFCQDTQHAYHVHFKGNKWMKTLGMHVCIVCCFHVIFYLWSWHCELRVIFNYHTFFHAI